MLNFKQMSGGCCHGLLDHPPGRDSKATDVWDPYGFLLGVQHETSLPVGGLRGLSLYALATRIAVGLGRAPQPLNTQSSHLGNAQCAQT